MTKNELFERVRGCGFTYPVQVCDLLIDFGVVNIDPPKPETTVYSIIMKNDEPVNRLFLSEQEAHGYAYHNQYRGDEYTVYPLKLPADVIQPGQIAVSGYIDAQGEIILTAPNLYSGVGIETDAGTYGISMRDGGIEVMIDGKTVYRTGQVAVDVPDVEDWLEDSTELRIYATCPDFHDDLGSSHLINKDLGTLISRQQAKKQGR